MREIDEALNDAKKAETLRRTLRETLSAVPASDALTRAREAIRRVKAREEVALKTLELSMLDDAPDYGVEKSETSGRGDGVN